VLEVLKPLGAVMARPEMGGTGLLLNGSVFGVLHGGLVYLKVDKKLREEYHAAGMRVLEPRPRQKLAAFLEVPRPVVEDAQKLLEHAARAAGKPVPKRPVPKTPAPKTSAAKETGYSDAPARSSKPARARSAPKTRPGGSSAST
jgi:DNA transformation protein and related proteins